MALMRIIAPWVTTLAAQLIYQCLRLTPRDPKFICVHWEACFRASLGNFTTQPKWSPTVWCQLFKVKTPAMRRQFEIWLHLIIRTRKLPLLMGSSCPVAPPPAHKVISLPLSLPPSPFCVSAPGTAEKAWGCWVVIPGRPQCFLFPFVG